MLGHRINERVPQVPNAAHVPQPAGLQCKQSQEGRKGVRFEARAGAPQVCGPAGGQVLKQGVHVLPALLRVQRPGGPVTAHEVRHVIGHNAQQPQARGCCGLVDARRKGRLRTVRGLLMGGNQQEVHQFAGPLRQDTGIQLWVTRVDLQMGSDWGQWIQIRVYMVVHQLPFFEAWPVSKQHTLEDGVPVCPPHQCRNQRSPSL
mmetsp:Transcript_114357/g.198868  ORF Transcript_114357/g.198868 Transcript_114357/m.198868 type:complete len:203 (+) Transcript_114357:1456-2064(+)